MNQTCVICMIVAELAKLFVVSHVILQLYDNTYIENNFQHVHVRLISDLSKMLLLLLSFPLISQSVSATSTPFTPTSTRNPNPDPSEPPTPSSDLPLSHSERPPSSEKPPSRKTTPSPFTSDQLRRINHMLKLTTSTEKVGSVCSCLTSDS